MPWTHRQTVRLSHTDAAGVIFYPRLLEMAHEAYEVFLDALGQPLAGALASGEPVAPIVRCEADYRKPMVLGAEVEIEITVEPGYDNIDVREKISDILARLRPRHAEVLRLRYGIGKQRSHTLAEIGRRMKLSRERIRQIEAESIRAIKSTEGLEALLDLVSRS